MPDLTPEDRVSLFYRGLCTGCGIRDPQPGRKRCEICTARQRKYRPPKEQLRADRKATRDFAKAHNLCIQCIKRRPQAGRVRCIQCLEYQRQDQARARAEGKRVAKPAEKKVDRRPKCAGRTKSGAPCGAYAERGRMLCRIHNRIAAERKG